MSNSIKKVIITRYLNDDFNSGMNELEAIVGACMGYSLINYSGSGAYFGYFAFVIPENIDNKLIIDKANNYLKEKGIDSIEVVDVCSFSKYESKL